MKGLVDIQRKLLEMMYIIFKNNSMYDKDYLNKKNRAQMQAV
jgi:transposase